MKNKKPSKNMDTDIPHLVTKNVFYVMSNGDIHHWIACSKCGTEVPAPEQSFIPVRIENFLCRVCEKKKEKRDRIDNFLHQVHKKEEKREEK